MKNLQIGDSDLFGKRFNGHCLQMSLNARGINSKHLVWKKWSDNINTYEIGEHFRNLLPKLSEFNTKYSLQGLFYPDWAALFNNKHFLESDVVHYHLLHNSFFNLSLLPILTKLKPSVWTIHDPWALTGHCVHPFSCERWKIGCGDCPDLETEFKINNDTSALNWEIKSDTIRNSNIDVIVASKWMQNLLYNSPIFSNLKIHFIPFGLDLNIFKPKSAEEAKMKLNIPPGNIVIGFRATPWKLKGLHYVKEALHKINVNRPLTLLTFNEKGLMNEFKTEHQVIDLGWVDNDMELTQAYNATDIFLMPSTAEAFGMMAMESMACGKPSIVFDGNALSEVIHNPEGGIAVPNGDVDRLAYELEALILNDNKRVLLGQNALKIAKKIYNEDRYVDDVISVYDEVIDKRKDDHRSIYLTDQLKRIPVLDKRSVPGYSRDDEETEMMIEDLVVILIQLFHYKFMRFLFLKIFYYPFKICFRAFKSVMRIK